MTEQQFNRAVQIQKRLEALYETKEKIKETTKNRLYYAYKNCQGDYTCCPEWSMRPISELLDKHDRMIRQEIEDEIERLKKEIETL